MRLAAIFIENQDLEKGGDTINLGGHFVYDVTVKNGECRIQGQESKIFIDNLFDEERIVTNVSAIVGTNGSGKTTLIYDLIGHLEGKFVSGLTIWEDSEKNSFLSNYNLNVKVIHSGFKTLKQLSKNPDTIYYSPYLDHKRPASGIDLSTSRYLAEDLNNIDSTFDANDQVNISERLKRNNYKRFISFQQSKFSTGISKRYGLLKDPFYRITFTRHKIKLTEKYDIDFHNTPNEFREYLNQLYHNIRAEYDDFDRSVGSDEERFTLNKKQMKNLILMDLFCLLINLMEAHNTYLEDAKFKVNSRGELFALTSELSAYEKLKYWLEHYRYKKGRKEPLPNKEVLDILSFLYDYIDNISFSNEFNLLDWTSKSLYFKEEDLYLLLDLNQSLLSAIPKYYLSKDSKRQELYEDFSDLQYFANFEFANRSLSSGENAMLNLFSRLYDFFDRKILNTQTILKNDYYILFLDEADLGYHPEWKRTYVSSIIDFCKSFFKELGAKVQIIISTHDAVSLSDIPNTNITYLDKLVEGQRVILNYNDPDRPQKSFAANITDLLADSFFLSNSLMGDFAKGKIQNTLDWLNVQLDISNDNKVEIIAPHDIKQHHLYVIQLIDEPLLKYKLEEMYYKAFPKDLDQDKARKQIEDIARRSGLDINFDEK